MSPVPKAKEFYWALREAWADLYLRLVLWIPLGIGVRARQMLLPSIVGGMGGNTVIRTGLRITTPAKFSIGSHCYIAEDVFITAGGGVRIGDWVGLGPDAKIWSVNHRYADPDIPWILQGWDYKEVVIEDDVWIGAGAFIMPGVHIGKGAIISACTVVMQSVPSYAVVAGHPGRQIGWRKKIEDLKKEQ